MKKIRRHNQSISLLAIAGVLLACAFFISQQIRSGEDRPRVRATAPIDKSALRDLPDCTEEVSSEAKIACYTEAVAISESLLDSLVDEFLALESDPPRRAAFLEAQIAWEDSQMVDCAFVRGAATGDTHGQLEELICLLDHNLARLALLEDYRCEWYEVTDCRNEESEQE